MNSAKICLPKYRSRIIVLLILISIHLPGYSDPKTFTVGVVPQFDARKIYKIWRPILTHLENETGYRFVLKGAQNIPSFEGEFENGLFDFVFMNPYHLVIANQAQGYQPLIRDVGRQLQGVLVIRKDSKISDVRQLNNKTIAFPAPNALGASLLMRAELEDKYGIKFTPKYVNTHSSVYLNVALSTTDAGGGVQKTLNKQPDSIRNELKILYRTEKVAAHPFSVHPRVERSIQLQVQRILIEMAESERTRTMLRRVPINKIGEASMSDYLPLKDKGLQNRYFKASTRNK